MEDESIPKSRYVRLHDQGSTFCLNRLLQCLFFSPEFREAILSCNNVGDSHIIHHLRRLFQERTVISTPNTEEIIQCLRLENVHRPLDMMECFQRLVSDMTEAKKEIRQLFQVKFTSYEYRHLMKQEITDLSLSLPRHKFNPPTLHYCFETLPQILVIHLEREPVGINAAASAPLSLALKTGEHLDTDYELFAVCHHCRGMQGDQYQADIKSFENNLWYRSIDTQVEEIPEQQIGQAVQNSTTASLLLYHRVNPDARPRISEGPCGDGNGEPVPGDPSSQDSSPACGAVTGLWAENTPMEVTEPPASSPRATTFDSREGISEGPRGDGKGGPVPGDPSSQGSSPACGAVTASGAENTPMEVTEPPASSPRATTFDSREGGYVGLRNQGSTCYLNSLLQCLFFTPKLRDAILSCDHVGGSRIVCQLRKLFEQLKRKRSAPSTEGITRCLGVRNVHQQQDVAEYFRILMNKIIEDKRDIQQLYEVEMVHSITCRTCNMKAEIKDTPILSLTLSLKSTSTNDVFCVDKALHDVQKVNDFTGDEQLYCETCKSKQNATSHYFFKTLPKILVLNLKRYQFDGVRFRKLHSNVSVPFSLTVELEKCTIHYELFAVCHHYGGIHGGHYVAEIKSYEDNCWYEFNDTTVYKVSRDQNTMDKKDSPTAYLLMYHTAKSVSKPRIYKVLRHQSCTCYLNSLLHCLFYTPELKNTILKCDTVGESDIVGHLQKLFKEMMTTDSSSPNTKEITGALEMDNVHQPLDVVECFQRLMSKITEAKEEIRQLYQVEMGYLITCHKCSYEEMLKDTTTLGICAPLQKQNSNCTVISMDHTLTEMQKERPYAADGQRYCHFCRSQETTLRDCFKTLPQILVIRVERDRVGINAGVSVPLSLTLGADKLDNDYKLFGMCHRIGTFHGDHYEAEVKPLEDSNWYRFSDKGVSEVPEGEISLQVQSSATVSLLMYRKVKPTAQPGLDGTNDKICSPKSATESRRNLHVAQQDSPGANQQESSMSPATGNTACCTDDTEEAAAHRQKQDQKRGEKRPNQCTRV